MTDRPRYPSLQEIVAALQARTEDVARAYAPGGGHVSDGKWWALNPGRQDKSVGSFYVNLRGPYEGRWRDEAMDEGGDMLDLIRLALGCDAKGALAEARAFLGMDAETPQQADLRRREAEKHRRAQAAREADQERLRAEARGQAHAMWLRAHERIEDTPVAAYLRGRGIGLDQLRHTPRAIRFAPALPYRHKLAEESHDPDTGEIIPAQWERGEYPAMLTAIAGPVRHGQPTPFWGVHRTWLAQRPDGSWGKAPVAKPKKVFGSMKGGAIRLVRGVGPRGGAIRTADAPPNSVVYLAEGIEDALSVPVILRRSGAEPAEPYFAMATISLSNMLDVRLHPVFRRVVLVSDVDPGERETRVIARAVERFQQQGRAVRVWRNTYGGKDLNDALQAAMAAEPAQ